MAPESCVRLSQLGGSITGLQRVLLKAAVPFLAIVCLSGQSVEARTEPTKESLSPTTSVSIRNEASAQDEELSVVASIPKSNISSSTPAGRLSDRIQITIPNHPLIQKYIRLYYGQSHATFMDSLERSWPHVQVMSEILESHGVPAEMVAVVLVESNFKRHASYRGAGGYWQLLGSTARRLGLRVDRWVDERSDPVRSTKAAARYLRSFYDQFESWPLALAAYNAGSRPIQSAIRKCGADDFWELSRRGVLPRGTQAYVPKVLAAVKVMRDHEKYRAERSRLFAMDKAESIPVQGSLHLTQVANWIETPVDHLRDLNPSLRQDRLPPDGGVELNVPSGKKDSFQISYDEYVRKQ